MIRKFLLAASSLITGLLPLHAEETSTRPAETGILLVLTNHSKLGDSGKSTGFFLSEAAHPWEVFTQAGLTVTLASPKGGFAPLDPKSFQLDDSANEAFWKTYGSGSEKEGNLGINNTIPLAEIKPEQFRAVFFAGGHGTMWDFRQQPEIQRVASAIYTAGGAIGAVCHGPAALIDLKDAKGTPLVKGRKITAFTNAEEEAVELTKIVPYLLETELRNAGALHQPGENFKENAVVDQRIATGQNPASAKKTAQLLVEALTSEVQSADSSQ